MNISALLQLCKSQLSFLTFFSWWAAVLTVSNIYQLLQAKWLSCSINSRAELGRSWAAERVTSWSCNLISVFGRESAPISNKVIRINEINSEGWTHTAGLTCTSFDNFPKCSLARFLFQIQKSRATSDHREYCSSDGSEKPRERKNRDFSSPEVTSPNLNLITLICFGSYLPFSGPMWKAWSKESTPSCPSIEVQGRLKRGAKQQITIASNYRNDTELNSWAEFDHSGLSAMQYLIFVNI